jgi:hypothetical protein
MAPYDNILKDRNDDGVNGSRKISCKTFRPLSQNHRQTRKAKHHDVLDQNEWVDDP